MRILTEEEKATIVAMYADGETLSDIRAKLKCRECIVSDFLKSAGMKRRCRSSLKSAQSLSATRKYSVDESFFSTIDNDIKAYWLGFLYADGSVYIPKTTSGNNKGGIVELGLMKQDEYHISSLLYDLNSDYKIQDRKIQLNDNTYLSSRVQINSAKMCSDLIKQGCVPAKSTILKPPLLRDDLIHHFIRGYFDGDGCVCFYPEYNHCSYSILGTKEILEYIKYNSGVSKRITIRKSKRGNFYEINMGAPAAVKKFFSYIYKDKTVFLERKWDKSLKMMKYLKAQTERSPTAALADLLD